MNVQSLGEAIDVLLSELTSEQKGELAKLPLITTKVREKNDFFFLVISKFKLMDEVESIALRRDIAKRHAASVVSDDLFGDHSIADINNSARIILTETREILRNNLGYRESTWD